MTIDVDLLTGLLNELRDKFQEKIDRSANERSAIIAAQKQLHRSDEVEAVIYESNERRMAALEHNERRLFEDYTEARAALLRAWAEMLVNKAIELHAAEDNDLKKEEQP